MENVQFSMKTCEVSQLRCTIKNVVNLFGNQILQNLYLHIELYILIIEMHLITDLHI